MSEIRQVKAINLTVGESPPPLIKGQPSKTALFRDQLVDG